jgi:hypothetical protein
MTTSDVQNYLNDLGGFRNQLEGRLQQHQDKLAQINQTVGAKKSKALQKAADLSKKGQALVNTAYEGTAVGAAGKLLKPVAKRAIKAIGRAVRSPEGGANNQMTASQGVDREAPPESQGQEMSEFKPTDAEAPRGTIPEENPGSLDQFSREMDEITGGAGESKGGEESKGGDDEEVEAAADDEAAGDAAGEAGADVAEDVGVEAAAEGAAAGLGEAAAATSWIPIVGEVLGAAAAAAGVGAGVAGLVEEAQGSAATSAAEALPDKVKNIATQNVAGSYVVPTQSSVNI